MTIPFEVFDAGVSSHGFKLYALIGKFADNATGEAWPSRAVLAGGLGMSKPDSVDRYLRELEVADLIKVRHRWKDAHGNVSFERSEAYRVRTSSLITLLKGYPRDKGQGCPRDNGEGALVARGRVPPAAGYELEPQELEPKNYQQGPAPIPDDWQPNVKHREQAQKRCLDVEAVAAYFKSYVIEHDWKRKDWDRAFESWLARENPKPQAVPRSGNAGGRLWQE
ncbi:helix-turn-helix domain-containing protein [Prescottella agglutinans]|uniref:helix-turn-helix domain-containing protein n=1 Tax=Prescottella agglutinans TaxID=1644129 RepID=UPI002476D47A|nr:helix-turn-helix domain-containing protein [Prescottella agglutinans]